MHRTLQPELLDSLDPSDPAALHNRRDLRITNQVMGNHRWIARTLSPLLQSGEVVLELGAGTGELGRELHRRRVAADALDLWPRPPDWPAARRWHQGDLRTFSDYAPYQAAVGNLIFHQFSEHELQDVGAKLRRSLRVIVACEPTRRRLSQKLFRLFAPALGANPISLHDAHVSIAAGFRGDELPQALGLSRTEWDFRCTTTALGAYRMVAVKRRP